MDRKKLIARIAENNKYHNRLERFNTSWLENGFECASDTFRVVRLYQPISDNLSIMEDYNISKFYAPINDDNEEYVKVVLPNIKELKENINNLIGRRYKTERVLYRLNNDANCAVVNAKYLMDMMEILEVNEIWYNKNKPKHTPLFFKSKIGDGLLLPVCVMAYDSDKIGYWKA